MTKVAVGFDFEEWGTIELSNDVFVLDGNKGILSRLIRDMQHDMPNKEFLDTLPARLRSRTWAKKVDEVEEKFNPYHVPAGVPEGGQFTSAPGAGSLSVWPTAEHQRRVEDNNFFIFEEHAANLGISVDEYIEELTEHVEEQVENANVAVRVTEDVLVNVLNDGRFKNQHETATSRGYLDPLVRAETEDKVWGEGRKVEDRPIYGYLYNENQPRGVGQYGDIIVILDREKVEDRTTFTVGDSLFAMEISTVAPRPIGFPDYLAVVGNDRDGLRSFPASGGGDHIYYEAQIHGGVSISDIQEVQFSGFLGSYDPELLFLLEENNIPFSAEFD